MCTSKVACPVSASTGVAGASDWSSNQSNKIHSSPGVVHVAFGVHGIRTRGLGERSRPEIRRPDRASIPRGVAPLAIWPPQNVTKLHETVPYTPCGTFEDLVHEGWLCGCRRRILSHHGHAFMHHPDFRHRLQFRGGELQEGPKGAVSGFGDSVGGRSGSRNFAHALRTLLGSVGGGVGGGC